MTIEDDGRIRLAFVEDSKLYLWSMEAEPQSRGDLGWVLMHQIIELKLLLSYRCPVKFEII
jgi:hypothetical protein